MEEDEEALPVLMLIVEAESGLIIGQRLFVDYENGGEIINCLAEAFGVLEARPSRIYVQHIPTAMSLEEICRQLEIELFQVEELNHVNEIQQMMLEQFAAR